MSEGPEWRVPAIGLVVLALLLGVGGVLKVSGSPSAASRRDQSARAQSLVQQQQLAQQRVAQQRLVQQRINQQGSRAPAPPVAVTVTAAPADAPVGAAEEDTGRDAEVRSILLTDPDNNSRAFAASTLGATRPVEAASILALIEALKDGDPVVRLSAADALGALGPPRGAATTALRQARSDEDPEVRAAVLRALRRAR